MLLGAFCGACRRRSHEPGLMLLLTQIVFVEKVLPKGQRISAAIGVWFVALGLAIAGGNLPPLEGL
jgi:hypothetical protein